MSVEQYIRKVRKQNAADARKAEAKRKQQARLAEATERARAKRAELERVRRAREQKLADGKAQMAKRIEAAKARAVDRAAAEEVRATAKVEKQVERQEKLEAVARQRVASAGKAKVVPVAKPSVLKVMAGGKAKVVPVARPGVLKIFLPKLTIRLPPMNQLAGAAAAAATGQVPKDIKAVHLRLKGAGVAKIRRVPARIVNVRLGGARTLNLFGAC
jgi:hypothetical protein